jgi:hypothetical protein
MRAGFLALRRVLDMGRQPAWTSANVFFLLVGRRDGMAPDDRFA